MRDTLAAVESRDGYPHSTLNPIAIRPRRSRTTRSIGGNMSMRMPEMAPGRCHGIGKFHRRCPCHGAGGRDFQAQRIQPRDHGQAPCRHGLVYAAALKTVFSRPDPG